MRTTSICGQPCRASQSRFGRNSASAIAPPITDPFRTQQPPLARKAESGDQRKTENEHRVLVFEADSGDDAEGEPPFRRCAFHDAHHDPRAEQPEERLERIHREEAVEGEIRGRPKDRAGGEKLAVAPGAQLTREDTGKEYDGRARQHGKQPDRKERIAEGVALEPRDERDQRRLVDVAPGEMLATGHVVELVAKEAVARDARELRDELDRGEPGEDGGRGEGAPARRHPDE